MQWFLLVLDTILVTTQSIFQKQYNLKTKIPRVFLFSALTTFSATVFFVAASGLRFEFNMGFLPYATVFGVASASSFVGLVYALRHGSMAITSLVTSYSLVIPTLYGIVFLNDPTSATMYIGLAALIVSMLMLNLKAGEVKFSWKWFAFAILAFGGNGMCSTVQKMQQVEFNGAYKNEFMITALGIATVIMLVFAVTQGDIKKSFKSCAIYAVPTGLANGAVNLVTMVLTGMMSNAILFPSVSAGGIVLSFLLAVFIYKEKLTKIQLTGYAIGLASVILLNI